MGIFDFVNFKMDCPNCGEPLEFQTKDGDPYMNTVDWRRLLEFHSYCRKCTAWLQFTRKLNPATTIEEFEKIVELPEIKKEELNK